MWFHGTDATLLPGETLRPGDEVGLSNFPDMDNGWGVWITRRPELAARYGANVYVVQPTGEVTDWAEENGWDRDELNDEFVCEVATVIKVRP